MVLGKIIAGLLAILSDVGIVGFFVAVNLTDAQISRGGNTVCNAANATASVTGCGQCLSDWIVVAISCCITVLNTTVSGLHV